MPTSRAIAEYHDFLVYVFLRAPDRFPEEDYLQPHEQMSLHKAMAELVSRLPALRARVKNEHTMLLLLELLTMATEAYEDKNEIRGAHILQEFEGLVWPKHKQAKEFAHEALRRIAKKSAGA